MRCRRSLAGIALALSAGVLAPAVGAAPSDRDLGPSILHVPVQEHEAEQGILTAIPVAIELPAELDAARVLLHYQVFGSDQWVSVQLTRRGQRFSGAIPCLEVSTITGDVRYYLRVHDSAGAVVAYSGTRGAPYKVRIVHDTARTDETLERPRCPDPSDCPAGLEGCPSEKVERLPCRRDADCEGGLTCGWAGFCEDDQRDHTRLGVDVAQEFGFVDTTGACSLASQELRGYQCLRESDGVQYFGVPTYTNEPVRGALGPTRVLVGVDRVVGPDATLGLRVGWAFRGGLPTLPGGVPFFPLLVEGRVTHWFGSDPFAPTPLRPFVLLSGGYAMFDLSTRTHVREDPRFGARQPSNDLEQYLEVRRRAGDGYVGLGAGASWTFRGHAALRGELDTLVVFPYGALIVTPRLGVEVGF